MKKGMTDRSEEKAVPQHVYMYMNVHLKCHVCQADLHVYDCTSRKTWRSYMYVLAHIVQ